jgi:hypothetical protein
VLELFEIEKIASVMAASKDDVAASWIVAECPKHFWKSPVSYNLTIES